MMIQVGDHIIPNFFFLWDALTDVILKNETVSTFFGATIALQQYLLAPSFLNHEYFRSEKIEWNSAMSSDTNLLKNMADGCHGI